MVLRPLAGEEEAPRVPYIGAERKTSRVLDIVDSMLVSKLMCDVHREERIHCWRRGRVGSRGQACGDPPEEEACSRKGRVWAPPEGEGMKLEGKGARYRCGRHRSIVAEKEIRPGLMIPCRGIGFGQTPLTLMSGAGGGGDHHYIGNMAGSTRMQLCIQGKPIS